MRKLILVSLLLLLTGACAGEVAPRQNIDKEFLNGSWELIGMSKEVVPVERAGMSDLLKGRLTFNADGTFSGDFIYPKSPEKNTKAFGTYTIDNKILTVSNQSNASSTRSELFMEKDVLIAKPLDPNGYAMYLRRAR